MSVPEWLDKEPVPPEKMDRFRVRVEEIGLAAANFEVNKESLPSAAVELQGIREMTDMVQEFIEPFRVAARANLDAVLARRRELVDPLKEAESLLKIKVATFRKQERQQIEALQEQAAAEAAEQRTKEMAEAEPERAAALANLPVVAEAIDAKPTEAEGIQFRETWKARFAGDDEESLRELCAAIGASKPGAAVNLVKVNWPAAHALARSMKSDLANLGIGLAAQQKTSVALEKKK